MLTSALKIDLNSLILTMWAGADVSGHAGSALPSPTVRSNTNSVLCVHLQLANVHILQGGEQRSERFSSR